jgi:pimeloyl-ACP methyl ester carboxylesterase/DNA-binding SARP family transcriptional activator
MKSFLPTENSTIYYEYNRCQKPYAETILLVHGMGLNMTLWDETVEGFRTDYHILRYDLPGSGQSELHNLEFFGWDLLIEDLESLLHHLNIKEVHFIGHSGAGNFGVELALREKDYLKSLILISTPLFAPSGITEKEIQERNSWNDKETFDEKMLYLAKNICYPEEPSKINRIMKMYTLTSIDDYLAYFNLYSHAIFHYNLDDLAEIRVPILMLVGEFDTLYPPQLLMVNLSFLKNASFLIVPNASNAIMIDRPSRFVEDTKGFLHRSANTPNITTYKYTEMMLNEMNTIVNKSVQLEDTRIQLNIIDKFELVLDGTVVEGKWKQRKAMQIITYIVYNRSVTREKLYDIFWAHYDLNKARNHLSVSLNHIKSMIETSTDKGIDKYFDIDRDMISLKHNAQIDILELQECLNILKEEKDSYQKLSRSLSLLQSLPENICAGFYDDWVISIKGNIEHQILNVCKKLMEIDLDDKHKADILKIKVKYNPLEETYYERLIAVLKKIGSPESSFYSKKLNRLLSLER